LSLHLLKFGIFFKARYEVELLPLWFRLSSGLFYRGRFNRFPAKAAFSLLKL